MFKISNLFPEQDVNLVPILKKSVNFEHFVLMVDELTIMAMTSLGEKIAGSRTIFGPQG